MRIEGSGASPITTDRPDVLANFHGDHPRRIKALPRAFVERKPDQGGPKAKATFHDMERPPSPSPVICSRLSRASDKVTDILSQKPDAKVRLEIYTEPGKKKKPYSRCPRSRKP